MRYYIFTIGNLFYLNNQNDEVLIKEATRDELGYFLLMALGISAMEAVRLMRKASITQQSVEVTDCCVFGGVPVDCFKILTEEERKLAKEAAEDR